MYKGGFILEKRKVYKISIIDKEISRTEFDRNTFYTSDSELSLVFKLIEKDYTYEHGEILLYNENDESFVTRQITKKENDFVYEIDSDIIPHHGTWKAQLQLVNDGDVYTSKPFEFKIINDLSNLAPQPTLTDINNWSTLKKNAAELIDEMQTVIDDIKKAESKHENAEMIRQNQENSRVQSESERQSQERLRSQGESQRQTQENKRVESENERRLKEIERNKNEGNRQQAETKRATAESSRASAEEQRKIDHANRSAELDDKADKVIVNNQIYNGDFINGTEGWIPFYSNIDAKEGYLTLTSKGDFKQPYIAQATDINYGDIYYGASKVKPLNEVKTIFMLFNGTNYQYINNPEVNKYNHLSFRHKLNSTNRYVGVRTELIESIQGVQLDITEVILINLTKTFGVGNEPTKEEMDELINVTGYIDGEYALNNKEMLIWTLALIRRNKNAIITLGGTI